MLISLRWGGWRSREKTDLSLKLGIHQEQYSQSGLILDIFLSRFLILFGKLFCIPENNYHPSWVSVPVYPTW